MIRDIWSSRGFPLQPPWSSIPSGGGKGHTIAPEHCQKGGSGHGFWTGVSDRRIRGPVRGGSTTKTLHATPISTCLSMSVLINSLFSNSTTYPELLCSSIIREPYTFDTVVCRFRVRSTTLGGEFPLNLILVGSNTSDGHCRDHKSVLSVRDHP